MQQAGAANTRDDFAYALFQQLEELVVSRMDRNGGQAGLFFENPEVRGVIQNWMLDPAYDRIRELHRHRQCGGAAQRSGAQPGHPGAHSRRPPSFCSHS